MMTKKRSTTSPPIDSHLTYLLSRAERQVNGQFDLRLRSTGITVEQWRILKALGDIDGRTMGELADAALMNIATLTRSVDRLVSSALLHRRADPHDRRKVVIFLSDQGRVLVEQLETHVADHEQELTEAYGQRSRGELVRLLERLLNNGY